MLNFGNKEFRNLQEQVLKNAQDIDALKGIKNLQVVIVEELPEVGNPNYIYLVAKDSGEEPDVYEEYIWLEDEERYEQIGGVSIDLTHYVTLDTDQTITATKKFQTSFYLTDNWCFKESASGIFYLENAGQGTGLRFERDKLFPYTTNYTNLGHSSFRFKNLYLSGTIDFGTKVANRTNTVYMDLDNYDGLRFYVNASNVLTIYDNAIYIKCNFVPNTTNSYDLGSNTRYFNNLYLTGNISDGVNTVSVANISTKTTSTYASGTFDSNGESTIDISGGEPEGLFIFTAGNCQTFMRLTATMIQNADLAPIAVPCPFVSGGAPVTSTLKITRSGTTLTLLLGTSGLHVSADVAWTLVKTNLI